jgi:hypothetical protein
LLRELETILHTFKTKWVRDLIRNVVPFIYWV